MPLGVTAGVSKPSMYASNRPRSIQDVYGDSVNRATSDYGNIMSGYQNLAKENTFKPISYNTSGDVTNALGSLKNFSETGGYSDQDINSIRERGISPIRSIYANAQQNLKRRLAIQGGYSPGYAAAVAKMARDSGQQISDVTNNVNANLAERIAQNKFAGAQAYGSLGTGEESRGLDTSKFNAENEGNYLNRGLSILDAQRGLYGTTPAQAALFGNQALEAQRMNQQQNQFEREQNQRAALSLIGRRATAGGY